MDFLMLITAYTKLRYFDKAKKVLSFMNRKGYVSRLYKNAVFGPYSCLSYQIICQGNKFKEAEELFMTLLKEAKSHLKPEKVFHMMIYMHRKAGNYEKARKIFALVAERGVQRANLTPDVPCTFRLMGKLEGKKML